MSRKVLITGGAGFIGAALGKLLINDHDFEITAVDNLLEQVHPTGNLPTDFDSRIRFIRADIRDQDHWQGMFSSYKPDYVIHLAAETGTAQSLTESARHSSVNVLGTSVLLDALIKADHLPKKFLISSSRSIYGEGAWKSSSGNVDYPGRRSHKQLLSGNWDFTSNTGEILKPLAHRAKFTVPNPSSVYAATKLAQEHILSSWCEAYGVSLAILRFQNVYGPGQSPTNPYTGIINIFHRLAARNLPIDVYEDGNIGRDFVIIDDVIKSCAAALADKRNDTTYADIGYGEAVTILQAAKIIAKLHSAPDPIVSGKFRDGDVRWAVADTSAMVNELGITPSVSFEEGAKRVMEWLERTGNLR